MVRQRTMYKLMGRYVRGNDTVYYGLMSDSGKEVKYKEEQMAFIVGRDQVVNVKVQLYHDKVLFRGIPFTEKCRQAGINHGNAKAYKLAHPELTDEQVIEMISNQETNGEPSLRSLCIKLGVDYGNYNTYRYNHRDLTPLQALMYYSGKCYINLLGELVILEED